MTGLICTRGDSCILERNAVSLADDPGRSFLLRSSARLEIASPSVSLSLFRIFGLCEGEEGDSHATR